MWSKLQSQDYERELFHYEAQLSIQGYYEGELRETYLGRRTKRDDTAYDNIFEGTGSGMYGSHHASRIEIEPWREESQPPCAQLVPHEQ